MRLAAEGFVRAIPRRGFHIADPSPEEIRDLWQVRRGLEVLGAELAIERLNKGEVMLAEVQELERRLNRSGPRPDILREHIELNARFHETIIALSGNGILMTLFSGLRMRLLGMWIKSGQEAWYRRISGDQAEHRAIVAALEARDVAAAREAITRHIERSLVDMLYDLEARRTAHEAAEKRSTNQPEE